MRLRALDVPSPYAPSGAMDITRAQVTEAINWATDCLGRITRVSAERAIMYVVREYEGGWDAFVQDMDTCWR